MSEKSIYGYFTESGQERPAYDPGLDVPCPICLRPLAGQEARTAISLLKNGSGYSYFFRAHRKCWQEADEQTKNQIEWALVDSEAMRQCGR